MIVDIIPTLSDNYSYLVREEESVECLIVDPGESQPIFEKLEQLRLNPAAILCTHKHHDHVAGIPDLIDRFPRLNVFANETDSGKISCLTDTVNDGTVLNLLDFKIEIIHHPCHTRGDVGYFFPKERAYFSGDTLFVGGCGRFFEGSADDMARALEKILKLPPDTKIYCGHEYTESNLAFALTLEPDNFELRNKLNWVRVEREKGAPTVPTTISSELLTNPYLRVSSAELLNNINMNSTDSAARVIEEIRERKNSFSS